MQTRSSLAAVAAVALFSAPAFAGVIVQWTAKTASNTATAWGPFANSGADLTATRQLDGTVDLGIFDHAAFAKWVGRASQNTGTHNMHLDATDTYDRVHDQIAVSGTVLPSFKVLSMVDKANFLTTDQVSFDSTSLITYKRQQQAVNTVLHFIVKDSGHFYMNTNPETVSGTSWSAAAFTFAPAAASWVEVNVSDISAMSSQTSGGSTMDFSNVQAIGIYREGSVTTSPGHVYLGGLVIDAVVPEPGTIALLGGSLAFGLLGRRKHA